MGLLVFSEDAVDHAKITDGRFRIAGEKGISPETLAAHHTFEQRHIRLGSQSQGQQRRLIIDDLAGLRHGAI